MRINKFTVSIGLLAIMSIGLVAAVLYLPFRLYKKIHKGSKDYGN